MDPLPPRPLLQELNVPFNVQRYHNLVPLEPSSEDGKPEQPHRHLAPAQKLPQTGSVTRQSRARSPDVRQTRMGSTAVKQTSSVGQTQSSATNCGPDIMDLYPSPQRLLLHGV